MPDTSVIVKRFEAGAVLTIEDVVAAATHTVKLVEPGTVEEESGGYEPLPLTDRGVMLHPYEGDEQPGKIRLTVKYTGPHASDNLRKILEARNTSGGAQGKVRMFNIVIKDPASKGSSTGEQASYNNCYVMPPVKIQRGAKFDTLQVEFVHNAAYPTTATF